MFDLSAFARYRSLLNDWDAFEAALHRPLPICIWANTLRISAVELANELATLGITTEPLAWWANGLRLTCKADLAHTLPYLTGCFHIQEEVSMVPPLLLDPTPGHRVLDLCAAPGNKSAQLAVQMANMGTLVANDRSRQRLYVVGSTIARLGLVNMVTTAYDAANYPKGSGFFDRILADVPCSCEGTSRKHPAVLQHASSAMSRTLARTQRLILDKAVQRCRSGGRIVYSTCTYAPEENEAVVDTVLRAHPETLRLLPARLPHFIGTPGLTEWDGASYVPEMHHTLRIWPHQQDTGGFFIAVLEKMGGPTHDDV